MTSEDLRLHDPVIITTNDDDELVGTVAHLGPVQFAPGSDWIGIKLTDTSVGRGKNNGTVKGVFYFDAGGENNGMFVRRANVSKMGDDERKLHGVNTPSPRNRSSLGRSASNSSEKSGGKSVSKSPAVSAAASSRENFLRRLEQQQQEKARQSIANEVQKESTDGDEKATASSVLGSSKSDTEDTKAAEIKIGSELKQAQVAVEVVVAKESTNQNQNAPEMPRGNHNKDMAAVMSFLSQNSRMTLEINYP
jgi:dynactin complex subunit